MVFCGILLSKELWPTAQDSSGQSVQFLECLPLQMSPNALKCLPVQITSRLLLVNLWDAMATRDSRGIRQLYALPAFPFWASPSSAVNKLRLTLEIKDDFFLCHTNQGLTAHQGWTPGPAGKGGFPAPPRKNDQNRGEVAGQNKGPNLNFLQYKKPMMEHYYNTEQCPACQWDMSCSLKHLKAV